MTIVTIPDFDDLARAIRDHIGFDSNDCCINGAGRYVRYGLHDADGVPDYHHGIRPIVSFGATGRRDPDAGGLAYREYQLPQHVVVGAGRSVTTQVPDFRHLVAALRRVGLRTNDEDFPGETPILTIDATDAKD